MPNRTAFTVAPSRKVRPKSSRKLKIFALKLPSFKIKAYWPIINSQRLSLSITGAQIKPPRKKLKAYINGTNGPVTKLVTTALALLTLNSPARKKAKINPTPNVGIKLMLIPIAHPKATLYGFSLTSTICFSIVL